MKKHTHEAQIAAEIAKSSDFIDPDILAAQSIYKQQSSDLARKEIDSITKHNQIRVSAEKYPNLNSAQRFEIKMAILDELEPTKIKFLASCSNLSAEQMAGIRQALEDGLTIKEAKMLVNPNYSAQRISMVAGWMAESKQELLTEITSIKDPSIADFALDNLSDLSKGYTADQLYEMISALKQGVSPTAVMYICKPNLNSEQIRAATSMLKEGISRYTVSDILKFNPNSEKIEAIGAWLLKDNSKLHNMTQTSSVSISENVVQVLVSGCEPSSLISFLEKHHPSWDKDFLYPEFSSTSDTIKFKVESTTPSNIAKKLSAAPYATVFASYENFNNPSLAVFKNEQDCLNPDTTAFSTIFSVETLMDKRLNQSIHPKDDKYALKFAVAPLDNPAISLIVNIPEATYTTRDTYIDIANRHPHSNAFSSNIHNSLDFTRHVQQLEEFIEKKHRIPSPYAVNPKESTLALWLYRTEIPIPAVLKPRNAIQPATTVQKNTSTTKEALNELTKTLHTLHKPYTTSQTQQERFSIKECINSTRAHSNLSVTTNKTQGIDKNDR